MPEKLDRTTANAPLPYPVKVLQFGKGNFLRAFADLIFDKLNEAGRLQGSIQMVQVNSTTTDNRFTDQEGLYHVVINGLHQGSLVEDIHLIRSVAPTVLNPFQEYEQYIRAGENPDLQYIISNTTEAGIRVDAQDVDVKQPATTFPGKLAALLYRRFVHFNADPERGLTFLPCELVEQNGDALRDAILHYAMQWKLPEEFSDWLREHHLFCNSLVDRIVPGFPADQEEELRHKTGFEDRLLVAAEPYHLWLLQTGTGPQHRVEQLRSLFTPALPGISVEFVDDLAPYRSRKVRILNGAHTAMVPLAYLRGLRTVRETIQDPFMGTFAKEALEQEIIPTLDLRRESLQQFAAAVIERFENPFIQHELKAIALNSVSKFRVRVLPSLLAYHDRTGSLPTRLVQALAALLIFYRGSWRGASLPVRDTPETERVFRDAWEAGDIPTVARQILGNTDLWQRDLNAVPGLTDSVIARMQELQAG